MAGLIVEGVREADPVGPPAGGLAGLRVEPRYTIRCDRTRGEGEDIEVDAEDDDIAVLDLGGVEVWTSVELLRRDIAAQSGQDPQTGAVKLSAGMGLTAAADRGAAGVAIQGLEIFGVDIAGEISEIIIDQVEGQLKPEPGLYRCIEDPIERLDPKVPTAASLKSDRPLLLLLHGTASTATASFGAFWERHPDSTMVKFLAEYPAVLAFQHRSLSQSPIENALELVDALPAGAKLHVISHSRGGMVAELVCRGQAVGSSPFDPTDLELFSGPGRSRDRDALEKLNTALEEKKITVDKFVRTACPARGTTLAGGRVDRYLSLLAAALKLTGGDSNPVVDPVQTLLAGVLKKRTDPEEIPGIEAMVPSSPLVRLLNRADRTTESDLHIIAGDLEGSHGVTDQLRQLATDLAHGEDHDLIVNTAGMFGGGRRPDARRPLYWIDQGPQVNHFMYFRNQDTLERVVDALRGTDDGFHTIEDTGPIDFDQLRVRSAEGARATVFLVPGIMGSTLKVGSKEHWIDLSTLAAEGMASLAIDAPKVGSGDPLAKPYGDLAGFLAAGSKVVAVGYDWRRSIMNAAEQLRDAMDAAMPRDLVLQQPVRVIAHSMGGLVFRAMLATEEGRRLWERACTHPGSRVVFVGTPFKGSHSIAAMLMGRDKLVGRLSLVDLETDYRELLRIVSEYPGVLELLPDAGLRRLDLFASRTWSDLRAADQGHRRGPAASVESAGVAWTEPAEADLARARAVRDAVAAVELDHARCIYVAGKAPATPSNVEIDPGARPGRRVRVLATANGDGRVTWSTGIPPELDRADRVWYMDAVHGDMCSTSRYFSALGDLLTLGNTTRLPKEPPVSRAAQASQEIELPDPEVEVFPDADDLVAAAVGGSDSAAEVSRPRVKVRVVNGHLASTRFPVMVGHYAGDGIFSAEDALDRVLQGRLRESHRLGLYPGARDTAAVFYSDSHFLAADLADRGPQPHPGAIVVGLGEFGQLTPGALTAGMVKGSLMHASRVMDREGARERSSEDGEAGGEYAVRISPVLIGTGAGGMSVTASAQSILRAVTETNERLEARGVDTAPTAGGGQAGARITEVEIIELWEDAAIQAVRALGALARSAEFRDEFEIEPLLTEGEGARRRATYHDDPGYWSRLRIVAEGEDALHIESISEGARTDAAIQPTQRRLVDDYLAEIKAGAARRPGMSMTLFEILLPNRLKAGTRDRRNILLQLDPQAAAYPWELLQDRQAQGGLPPAAASGMLRRLTVSTFRENPVGTASANAALVVGDPITGDKLFAQLPGARKEAEMVHSHLAGHFAQVNKLIGRQASPTNVVEALFERPYRVVHLAGHGVFEHQLDEAADGAGGRTVSGMVLGNGIFLTAAEAEQMRYVPELVFLNCCFLAETTAEDDPYQTQYQRLAANLATQFIRMGVRCVVAAGWAVDDDAALTFAGRFYEEILAGTEFGEAVKTARIETYLNHPQVNTWGAYQCYGDPYFKLAKAAAESRGPSSAQVCSGYELELELEQVIRTARRAGAAGRPGLLQTLETLEAAVTPSWEESASLQVLFAQADGELGRYEQALARFEKVLDGGSGAATLGSLQHRIRYRISYAEELEASGKAADRKAAAKQLELAEQEIGWLMQAGATAERKALQEQVRTLRSDDTAG